MKKILFIVGATATGKTELGLDLADRFGGEIISADSRQVYRGMDIGTGKDLPSGVQYHESRIKNQGKNIGFYVFDKLKLWGYDLVEPDDDFSVAHYTKISWKIIEDIWSRNKLPIVVGGTGFYIKSLISPPSTIGVPIDKDLRSQIEKMPATELRNKLIELDPGKLEGMNNSDMNNPRRLVRAIEVAASQKPEIRNQKSEIKQFNSLWIGLKMDLDTIDERIGKRVKNRVEEGFEAEFTRLYESGALKPGTISGDTLGYRQWYEYVKGIIIKQEAIANWTGAEKQYARRQVTWFKKMAQIDWYDPTKNDFKKNVLRVIKNWYSKEENGEGKIEELRINN